MAEPYVGEIRCFGFNFAPQGWAACNGQLMSIAQNAALFTVIGTTYGGDGSTTFGLPNLQGRVPMHWGNGPSGFNTVIGQTQGQTDVTLATTETPAHTHAVTAQEIGSGGVVLRTPQPNTNSWLASSNPDGVYNSSPTINTAFASNTINVQGGSQPHTNMQPYLVLNFCMALEGIFPSQN
jgi:microcystin-dependent protein